jgi:Suppressor of fused protein (SUFU)
MSCAYILRRRKDDGGCNARRLDSRKLHGTTDQVAILYIKLSATGVARIATPSSFVLFETALQRVLVSNRSNSSLESQGDRIHVRAHIEKHLGAITRVFDAPSGAPADHAVLLVASHDTRPVHTLITLGLSDTPTGMPAGKNASRYIELMMTLPRTWRFDEKSLQDERWYWPVRQLFNISGKPGNESSRLGWGEVVPNGNPPQPYARNTKLCGAVIVPSLLVPQEFYELKIAAHSIAFFSLLPLYKEEMELQADKGVNHLFETLIDAGVKDFIDPARRNVAKKRFGFF